MRMASVLVEQTPLTSKLLPPSLVCSIVPLDYLKWFFSNENNSFKKTGRGLSYFWSTLFEISPPLSPVGPYASCTLHSRNASFYFVLSLDVLVLHVLIFLDMTSFLQLPQTTVPFFSEAKRTFFGHRLDFFPAPPVFRFPLFPYSVLNLKQP